MKTTVHQTVERSNYVVKYSFWSNIHSCKQRQILVRLTAEQMLCSRTDAVVTRV